jgi:hypothetical protein
MPRLAHMLSLACLSVLATAALAFDNGQYENVPPDIRAWFKSVMAPNGVPCCDISDGHRTSYDFREGAYWVPIEGQWIAVRSARSSATAVIRSGKPLCGTCITAAASSSAALFRRMRFRRRRDDEGCGGC